MDLDHLEDRGARLAEWNTFSGDVIFSDDVVSEGPVTVGGLVNGQNLTFLHSDLIRSVAPQEQNITGHKHFLSGWEVAGDLDVDDTVNGTDLDLHLLLKSSDNIITGSYIFSNLTLEGHLVVPDWVRVGGVSVVELDTNRLKTQGHNRVLTQLTFNSVVEVVEDTHIPGLISGVNLTRLMSGVILLAADDITLHQSALTLAGQITALDHVNVTQNTNDRKLADFVRTIYYINENLTLSNPTFSSNLTVTTTLYVDGDVDVEGQLCHHDINRIFDDAFYTDRDIDVTVPYHHQGPVEFANSVTIDGGINGFELNADVLLKRACLSAGDISVMVGGAEGSGDEEEETDLVGQPSDQQVTGRYTIPSLTLLADLTTSSTINNHTLHLLYQDTVTQPQALAVQATKVLTGTTMFTSHLSVSGLIHGHLVHDLVGLEGGYRLEGHITVTGDTNISGDVTVGSVNSKDLGSLCASAFYRSGDVRVDGEFVFGGRVSSIESIELEGLVNNIDIETLHSRLLSLSANVSSTVDELEEESSLRCSSLSSLQHLLTGSVYSLDYFVERQTLGVNTMMNTMMNMFTLFTPPGAARQVVVAGGSPWGLCSVSRVYGWDQGRGEFTLTGHLPPAGLAKQYHALRAGGQLYMVYIDYIPACCGVPHQILVYNTTTLQFDLHQSLPDGYYDDVFSLVLPEGDAFLVLLGSYNTHTIIYRFDPSTHTFAPLTSLESSASGSGCMFRAESDGDLYVTFTNTHTGYYIETHIYTLYTSTGLSLYQTLYIDSTSDVKYFNVEDTDFLVYAVNKVALSSSSLDVKIFSKSPSDSQFNPYQSLSFTGESQVPQHVQVFRTGDPADLYLTVTGKNMEVQIYQYKYASHFVPSQRISELGIGQIVPFYSHQILYLVAADAGASQPGSTTHIRLYQAKMLGVDVDPVPYDCSIPDTSTTFNSSANTRD